MSNLKISGTVGGNFSVFSVEGVEGVFRCASVRGFCHVVHWVGDDRKGLVCSVSNGVYASEGVKAKKNDSKHDQIVDRLEKYISKIAA